MTPASEDVMPDTLHEELGLLSLEQFWCDLAPLRESACCGAACLVVREGWSATVVIAGLRHCSPLFAGFLR